jgi:hypothetical protein
MALLYVLGTSGLLTLIGIHPKIKRTEEDEIHFFTKMYSKGLEWYRYDINI